MTTTLSLQAPDRLDSLTVSHAGERPLSTLRRGEIAQVQRFDLDAADVAWLGALGVVGGGQLTVCRPGRLCVIDVDGTRVGLSSEWSQRLWVQTTQS